MAHTKKQNGGGVAFEEKSVVNGSSGRFVATNALTELQSDFVREYVRNGGNVAQAAKAAGYKTTRHCYEVLNLPHVRQAIQIEREKVLETDLPSLGVKVIKEMLQDVETPKAVKAKLAMWAVDRVHGTKAGTGIDGKGKSLDEMTFQELQDFAKKGRQALDEMERANGRIIDASTEVVSIKK